MRRSKLTILKLRLTRINTVSQTMCSEEKQNPPYHSFQSSQQKGQVHQESHQAGVEHHDLRYTPLLSWTLSLQRTQEGGDVNCATNEGSNDSEIGDHISHRIRDIQGRNQSIHCLIRRDVHLLDAGCCTEAERCTSARHLPLSDL